MAEEKEKPLSRDDLCKLIDKVPLKTLGLNLSDTKFERGVDLRNLDLRGIILERADLKEAQLQGAYLWRANLKGATLLGANLEGAILQHAHLENADLSFAHLDGAVLSDAHFEGVKLYGVEFSPNVKLENVVWENYTVGRVPIVPVGDTYRKLKMWYTNAGMYEIAGKFFYREMEAKRKALKWWPNPAPRVWSKFLSLICGYGERPLRVIGWAASVVLSLALIYFIIGSVWKWSAFWSSLYFSAVSFTALGYGGWLQATNDWIKGIGAFESFIGVFTIALFLITFIRKMTR